MKIKTILKKIWGVLFPILKFTWNNLFRVLALIAIFKEYWIAAIICSFLIIADEIRQFTEKYNKGVSKDEVKLITIEMIREIFKPKEQTDK